MYPCLYRCLNTQPDNSDELAGLELELAADSGQPGQHLPLELCCIKTRKNAIFLSVRSTEISPKLCGVVGSSRGDNYIG